MSEHDANRTELEHEPQSYREMRSSAYLAAEDLQGQPRTKTVAKVVTRELLDEKGNPQVRGVIRFSDAKKEMILNVTNAICLEAMFGPDPRALVGKRITLAPEMDKLQGKPTLCVRVVGSPDIAEDMNCTVKLPRKAAKVRKLLKTKAGA